MVHHPRLFTAIKVGSLTVKNRIVVPPMADFGATASDGMVNDRHIRHYGAFAAGGAGMVVVEACAVTAMKEFRNTIGVFSDSCIAGMRLLAEAATANNTISLVQLINSGLINMKEKSISQIPRKVFIQYKKDFISAARRCQEAGFHGVQLHAAHGFYLNQIVETSERHDEYGGCFNNRIRILEELIDEVKTQCGFGFLVSVRFGNRSIPELLEMAQDLEKAGSDMLDISTGMADQYETPGGFPFDSKIYAASVVKKVSGVPVVGVGCITSGEQAEKILDYGYADMVAIGTGHLCDPAWARKIQHGATPLQCRNCRNCLWFVDGMECPAADNTRRTIPAN